MSKPATPLAGFGGHEGEGGRPAMTGNAPSANDKELQDARTDSGLFQFWPMPTGADNAGTA